MAEKQTKAVYDQASALAPLLRFMEHLPKNTNSTELTLLKVHLLLEQELTALIASKMDRADLFDGGDFNFSRKVKLARCLYDIDDLSWHWEALKKLTEARNKLAHNLNQEVVDKKIAEFVDFVEKKFGAEDEEKFSERFGRLHWAVFKLYTPIALRIHFILHPRPKATIIGDIKIS